MDNKTIIEHQNKYKHIPARTNADIEKDFKYFTDQLERPEINKVNLKQKLSLEQIADIMNRLQYELLSKNVFIKDNITLTVKPSTSLFQLIRLYGHNKYIKGRDIALKQSDISPDNKPVKKRFWHF